MFERYYRLSRIGIAYAPYYFAFFFGITLSNAWDLGSSLIACVSIFLVCCAGHAANYIVDIEVDQLATKIKDRDPQKNPVLTGEISIRNATLFVLLMCLIAVLSASLVNRIFLVAIIIMMLGGIGGYSLLYFKSRPFLDITFPLSTTTPLLISGYYLIDPQLSFPLLGALFILFWDTASFLDGAIHDIDFDRQAGLNTTGVYLGEQNTIRFQHLLRIGALITAILGCLFQFHLYFIMGICLVAISWLIKPLMQRVYVLSAFGIGYLLISLVF